MYIQTHTYIHTSHQFGLVVSVSASHAVGCEFVPLLGHDKDHHKNGIDTPCLARWNKGYNLAVQPNCIKGW